MPTITSQLHFYDASPERLAAASLQPERWWPWLSEEERHAVQRFKFAKDQQQSLCAHALKRQILAQCCACAPDQLKFERTEVGKPYLPDYPEWHFNVSHSHGLILVGARHGVPIGVDIEVPRDTIEPVGLAKRFFSAVEADRIATCADSVAAQRLFYRFWVAKEAIIKAVGGTIAQWLDQVIVDLVDDRVVLVQSPPGTPDSENWYLEEYIPVKNALGAVASPAPLERLEFFVANLP